VTVWGDEHGPRDDPRASVRLEFRAPCRIIFQDARVSLELAGEYRIGPYVHKPDLVYGHLSLKQADSSGDRWTVRGGKPGTEFVNVEWRPECRISGAYQGYGLRYYDEGAEISYDVDVSMTFEMTFVVGSVFPAAVSNWGCKDDPGKPRGEL
jgi:hypothetical protein